MEEEGTSEGGVKSKEIERSDKKSQVGSKTVEKSRKGRNCETPKEKNKAENQRRKKRGRPPIVRQIKDLEKLIRGL